jgi:hypothetical protein
MTLPLLPGLPAKSIELMSHRYTLEKYKGGGSRHTCPSCGHASEFVRYVDVKTGQYLADYVGRCNREVGCGYHYKPGQYFAENPASRPQKDSSESRVKSGMAAPIKSKSRVDFIPVHVFRETLTGYNRNAFVQFLLSRFSVEEVQRAVETYFIGTWDDGRTVFWQIDARRRVRTGKLMSYDPATGKRHKDRKPSWVHAELKSSGALDPSFNLEQCLFGEHLLALVREGNTVGIVESEKTAVVASMVMPDHVWLATGGSNNLRPAQLGGTMRGRRVVLFPDSSKFEAWSSKAQEMRRNFGLNVKVSDLLERWLGEEKKKEDYDIADFLIMNKKVKAQG